MSGDLHDLAAAYALDAMPAEEVDAFERHLAGCDSCRNDVREFRETAATLAVAVAEQPSVELRERVLAAVAATRQRQASAAVPSLTQRGARPSTVNRWLAGIAAAAVLVAGGLGVAAYQASERADEAQATARQVAAVLADPSAQVLRGDVAGGGEGTLVISQATSDAVFLTQALADAGSDQTYQLWAIDAQGATSLGLLTPDGGRASQWLEVPTGTTDFGMTVEPAGGSLQPTTEPVLVLDLSSS